MRLINATSRELERFDDDTKIPPYAILSHTWGAEEVSLQQFQESYMGDEQSSMRTKNMLGYAKIVNTCKQALSDDYAYVWVDTCCIDKTSSAELSEAINSMFRWYQNACLCYAFLEDVTSVAEKNITGGKLTGSRWFTRGWTLQELIAPRRIDFYATGWTFIGTKKSLQAYVTAVTGIDEKVLQQEDAWRSCSVAKRMSWAAKRTTTRTEDIAYSLMGLFEINMPLLYGEGGQKAFARLQENIMMQDEDQSLLAWNPSPDQVQDSGPYGSIFAKHPRNFASTHNVIGRFPHGETPTVTNRGVRIELPVLSLGLLPEGILRTTLSMPLFIGVLYCSFAEDDHKLPAILLRRISRDARSYTCIRDIRLPLFPVSRDEVDVLDARQIYLHRQPKVWHRLEFRKGPVLKRKKTADQKSEEVRMYQPNDGYDRAKAYLEEYTRHSHVNWSEVLGAISK